MRLDPSNDLPTTRGLLMALSRKRAGFFVESLPAAIVVSILTLGVRPLLEASKRLDSWRRFEWLQLREFAAWLARSVPPLPPGEELGEEADAAADAENVAQHRATQRPLPSPLPEGEGVRGLIADADRFATPHGPDWTVRIAAIGALAIAGIALARQGVAASLDTVFQPQSLRPSALAFSALLALAWILILARLLRHHARLMAWLAALSTSLATIDLRPVAMRPFNVPWVGLALASLLAIVGPTWAAAMVATIALQNTLVRDMRPSRLQLVERLLELTDDSGLPVEFDVEAAAPESFVVGRVA